MVRLFTFNRLSLLRELRSANSIMTSAVSTLSSSATTFDCHLLQRPSVHRPLDALGTVDQQERLRAAVADHAANVVVFAPLGSQAPEFPKWVNVAIRTETDVSLAAAVSSQIEVNAEKHGLEWFHFELPGGDDSSRWTAAALDAVAAAQAGDRRDIHIVTAIGGEADDHGRFESLLWEGGIRLPLWIRDRDRRCSRVNRPTGSFDVLETVLACLDARGDSALTDRPIDLRTACRETNEVPSRSIHMMGEDYEAVRIPDFLYVRVDSQEFGEKTALYAKPHDVWNVHDLSHEFPHVADELLRQLRAVPGKGD